MKKIAKIIIFLVLIQFLITGIGQAVNISYKTYNDNDLANIRFYENAGLRTIIINDTQLTFENNIIDLEYGTYVLETGAMAKSYNFLNWVITGDIEVENLNSHRTNITVFGDGTITSHGKFNGAVSINHINFGLLRNIITKYLRIIFFD